MFTASGFSNAKWPIVFQSIPAFMAGENCRGRWRAWEWAKLRTVLHRLAGYKCEACGAGLQQPELHEVWELGWEGPRLRVRLDQLVCLCGDCHGAAHLPLWHEVLARTEDRTYLSKLQSRMDRYRAAYRASTLVEPDEAAGLQLTAQWQAIYSKVFDEQGLPGIVWDMTLCTRAMGSYVHRPA